MCHVLCRLVWTVVLVLLCSCVVCLFVVLPVVCCVACGFTLLRCLIYIHHTLATESREDSAGIAILMTNYKGIYTWLLFLQFKVDPGVMGDST